MRAASAGSLHQFQALFGSWLPPGCLAQADEGPHSRHRQWPLRLVFWTFCWQIAQAGASCREAIGQAQALLAQCLRRDVHAVFRVRGKVRADFRRGQRLSKVERLVTWSKPKQRPRTIGRREWKTLPDPLTLRLVRRLMPEAARQHHIQLDRISFAGSLAVARRYGEALLQARSKKQRTHLYEEFLRVIAYDRVPDRPGRREPRAVKRRPKPYPRLMRHRHRFREINLPPEPLLPQQRLWPQIPQIFEALTNCHSDLTSQLRKLGHRISGTTRRGEDAVSLARQQPPDLVLMDIRLAGEIDGTEAARQIRSELGLPVVFLTAHSDQHTLERAKQAEVFGYILKPFDVRDLAIQIEIALHKHQVEQKLRASEQRLSQLNAELEQRVLERTARLRALNAEHDFTQERQGIVQILHDQLEPPLTAACFHMEAAISATGQKDRRINLRKALELIRQATGVSRDLRRDLRPSVPQDFGLVESLRWLGNHLGEKHSLNIKLQVDPGDTSLPQDATLLLFHGVRELLLHTVKVGRAQRITLKVIPGVDQPLAVEVRECRGGRFPEPRVDDHVADDDLCLLNVRERLQQRGGRLEVELLPERGGVVRLIAPA